MIFLQPTQVLINKLRSLSTGPRQLRRTCSIIGGDETVRPDLAVGLIKVRDATQRAAEEGLPPCVVELTATISNRGDGVDFRHV